MVEALRPLLIVNPGGPYKTKAIKDREQVLRRCKRFDLPDWRLDSFFLSFSTNNPPLFSRAKRENGEVTIFDKRNEIKESLLGLDV